MPLPDRSLAVVGADHPNKRGPGRRFEIRLCHPGDPVQLMLEPKNPVDPNAIMVLSERGVCIGYVRANRAVWLSKLMRDGADVRAAFQSETEWGAVIRISLDGSMPDLPPLSDADAEPDFHPDPEWPD